MDQADVCVDYKNMNFLGLFFLFLFSFAVSSDFTADEKMEIESIKTYKKDLLDDIQVHGHTQALCWRAVCACVCLLFE